MQKRTLSQESIRPTAILDYCLPILAPAGTFGRGIQEDSNVFRLINEMQKSFKKLRY